MLNIRGRMVRETLDELVDPATTCLLVIDMQNDLCEPTGAFAATGAEMDMYPGVRGNIRRLVDGAREAGVRIIWVRATSLRDHASQSPAQLRFELRMKQNYGGDDDRPEFDFCIPGTWGHDVCEDLGPRPDDMFVDKFRSSAFAGTPLDLLLRSNGIESFVAVGCTTEGCVDSTVRDGGFLDYYTVVPRDAVGSDKKELHDAAMVVLAAYRTDVVSTDDIVESWRARART